MKQPRITFQTNQQAKANSEAIHAINEIAHSQFTIQNMEFIQQRLQALSTNLLPLARAIDNSLNHQ